jgi:hypothetical protein
MHRHREKIFAALSDANARFTIALAYTGEQTLSKEAHAPLDDLLSEMNSPSEVVALRILNQGELHGTVASGAAGESIYLEVMLQQWGMLQAPYLAYYGQASVGDIASWASFGNRLTAKNLRQFKGLTEVNESITRTLTSSPDRFWYFNNGITVLCESLRKKPLGGASNETGMFECHGASVVNGAQTVGAIVEASTKAGNGSLTGGRVLVRLVSLEDCPPGFGDEMTRATNTQNRIEKRDFAALDPNQRRLRTELYLEHQKEYAYQTGEQAPSESAGCTLDEAAVALACRMPEVSLAVQAKREVGMLYEDITKPPYTALFNPGTTAAALWDAVCILRLVEAQLKEEQQERSGKEQLIAIHGNRFVLHMVFQALAKPAVAESDDAKKAQVVASLTSSLLAGTIDKVLQHFQAGYPANLFKNASKCRDLKNFITGAA